ncbi:capsule biosynthesis protein [Pseudooceanicola algae]|uniref:Uncharacterized protein n=1 Tax=Pseudooceanicola algae TaxID=1537215 RepID=A0A418SCE4_9RHOB|nr:capsule biosynthesis protein CapA [Pseudooceanicola algae]QPM90077.1 hypothetical protein PSAL_013110 [Pseudooceanicola algae]
MTTKRVFLFLQGPHGPYFRQLAHVLRLAGADAWRVGFNTGDAMFWGQKDSYIPFPGPLEDWDATLIGILEDKSVTDIVLYGDSRPIHARALACARERGLGIHVFEEGYLRPYWVSYERDGSNGNSRLMQMQVPDMRAVLASTAAEPPVSPARWGDMRQHIFYGALYHFFVMVANRRYGALPPHRGVPVSREFLGYLKGLLLMPVSGAERRIASWRIRRGRFPYHLALLQLDHDSSFQMHSPFATSMEFLTEVLQAFAAGAPQHHHLVIKTHPLDDGGAGLRRDIRRLTRQVGLTGRVHFLRGGKLAQLLADTRSAVTVNSTSGQQVLYRGIPLRSFGAAVYNKPEFISTQPLPDFFAGALRPDRQAYGDYRRYLLETSQVAGGFYSARARRQLLRQIVDMMLAPEDPYDALKSGKAAPRQQLRLLP